MWKHHFGFRLFANRKGRPKHFPRRLTKVQPAIQFGIALQDKPDELLKHPASTGNDLRDLLLLQQLHRQVSGFALNEALSVSMSICS
jgi:hypothetical protein